MCGISGLISPVELTSIHIKTMTDLIRHRGPDGEGYVLFGGGGNLVVAGSDDTSFDEWNFQSDYQPTVNINETTDGNKVAFGHRRLSILDLSPCGHQPMSAAENRYWITFNGEVYNYRELRQELADLGYQFCSHTDTEVILAAYIKWGINCQERFIGMWAFAIYDNLTQEIFISRDRFGIKPLYYWFSPDGTFCFGSEIKQFTCLPGWLAKINSPRVYDYLVYSITDHTDETMFKGVYQLPGGHCFKANIGSLETILGGKLVSVKWYDLKYKKFRGSFDEAAKHFNTLFKSAVDLHLRADVPVGSALSGGLDSSAIVCEVSNILKELGANHLQKTFSSCSTDERFDEKKWIDIVVAQTSVDAHFIYPKYEDVFKMISSLTWSHDEPYQSQSAFLGYHVFKSAAQNGVKVLLNGQGADEYLGGYSQFTISRYNRMFRRLKWRALFRDLKKSGEYKKVSYTSLLQNMLYATLPVGIKNWVAANFGSYTRAKGLISLKALGSLPSHPFNVIPARHRSVPEISRHMTLFSTLPKYLKWEDRNSMANSVEARVPFLDHRLVEFAYNMPDNFLENGWQTKLILREGLKDILPPEIKERKDKKGFITPEEKWVKEDAPILFREKFKEAIEQSNGIIKPEAIKYFDDILTGKIPFDFMYWRIIQFSEWRQLFNISN